MEIHMKLLRLRCWLHWNRITGSAYNYYAIQFRQKKYRNILAPQILSPIPIGTCFNCNQQTILPLQRFACLISYLSKLISWPSALYFAVISLHRTWLFRPGQL